MYVNCGNKGQNGGVKFTEGWLELKTVDGGWKKHWCVLLNNTVQLFNNQRECKDNMKPTQTLHLSPEARLDKVDSNDRTGFLFHLRIGRVSNTFKAAKVDERELWKGCVDAVVQGKVNNSLNLLPGQINDIRINLQEFRENGSMLPASFSPADVYSQDHMFYPHSSRTDVPSWFFSACSRELSQTILTRGIKFGNTLMRESTSERKLVISKRLESAMKGQEFIHYQLQKTPLGYKIDVENPHNPMQSLSEVMEFFVSTSGKEATRPMTTNDLSVLGLDDGTKSTYSKLIISSHYDEDSGERTEEKTVLPSQALHKEDYLQPDTIFSDLPRVKAPPVPHLPPDKGYINTKPSFVDELVMNRRTVRSESVPNLNIHRPSVAISYDPQSSRLEEEVAPPLPPNHPPSLKKAYKVLGVSGKEELLKKSPPKHTQSMSSADNQSRKLSPRGHWSDSYSDSSQELAKIAPLFNKSPAHVGGATSEPTKPVNQSETKEEDVLSPSSASQSFKKKLEGIVASTLLPGQRPSSHSGEQPPCESIAHYQNANFIQKAGK